MPGMSSAFGCKEFSFLRIKENVQSSKKINKNIQYFIFLYLFSLLLCVYSVLYSIRYKCMIPK